MSDYDLLIKGGTIFDGSGQPGFLGDVAIKGNRIVAVGQVLNASAVEEIDALGLVVTPGFVDIHTHYDGQATWENRMAPSSHHGVTTVVAGNCGVGFAPCRAPDHPELVRLMEGVEDIPEIVMTEGLPWNWETFPDYLEALENRQFDVDIAVHVPHSALRVYVMGKRGADREPATEAEIAQMRALVAEAVRAGAVGVSTSRMLNHRTKAGEQAPSINAAEAELHGLAGGLRDAGAGVFQLITNVDEDADVEFDLMERLVETSGRPLSFSLVQSSQNASAWKSNLLRLNQRSVDAVPIRGQVFPRPIGMLLGLELSFHPFVFHPSFKRIANLTLSEKLKIMRDPAFKSQILTEVSDTNNPFEQNIIGALANMYVLGNPPVYNPSRDQSIGALAARKGISIHDLAYDLLQEQDGHLMLYWPAANFVDGDLDAAKIMMADPKTVLGLGDGGAHYGLICDSSFPTYLLSWWARDAPPEKRIPLAMAIRHLTREPAEAVGFYDRGIIAIGAKADLNLIDYDKLKLYAPQPVRDLPAGGRRLIQKSDGFHTSIVNGCVTYRNGLATDRLPGRLIRAKA